MRLPIAASQRILPIASLLIVSASVFSASAALSQSQSSSANGDYSGVSRPPAESMDVSPDPAASMRKPSAGGVASAPTAPAQNDSTAQNYPQSSDPQLPSAGPAPDPDSGSISNPRSGYSTPDSPSNTRPALASRPVVDDPDGDMIRPREARPGELLEGSTIHVKLLGRLSSTQTERGEDFHGQVAYDVLQNGRVIIPAGSGIEGKVTSVSSGHFAGHGSLHLRPDTVILPDGNRYRLHAETTGTQGSKTRVGSEGSINPGSRAKKDGIEYGAVVGTGAIAGAVLGGPVGALTGGLVGAGIVTTHLMVDHPQTTLEPGTIVLFTLTEPMQFSPAGE